MVKKKIKFRKVVEKPKDYFIRKAESGYYGSGFGLLILFILVPIISPLLALIISYFEYKQEREVYYERL
jgi:hypothetical protein